MPQVYKREGTTPLESWNELLRRVNALVPDCPNILPLPEVSTKHKWSTEDVEKAQNKLKELCDENTFSAIPATWKQSIVDELISAIAKGVCCCEEDDRIHPSLNIFAFLGGFKIFSVIASGGPIWSCTKKFYDPPQFWYDDAGDPDEEKYIWVCEQVGERGPFVALTLDWAGWAKQKIIEEFDEEIVLATGEVLLVPSGGPGWVGRQFKTWQVFLMRPTDLPGTPIKEGPVIDGYVFIGGTAAEEAAQAVADAEKKVRDAKVKVAQAQVDLEAADTPEEIAAAQNRLNAAQAEQEAAEAELEAAEALADANPPTANYPWIAERISPGKYNLRGQGPKATPQYANGVETDSKAFRNIGNFILDTEDAPYVLDVHPLDTAAGILRLNCEVPA